MIIVDLPKMVMFHGFFVVVYSRGYMNHLFFGSPSHRGFHGPCPTDWFPRHFSDPEDLEAFVQAPRNMKHCMENAPW